MSFSSVSVDRPYNRPLDAGAIVAPRLVLDRCCVAASADELSGSRGPLCGTGRSIRLFCAGGLYRGTAKGQAIARRRSDGLGDDQAPRDAASDSLSRIVDSV